MTDYASACYFFDFLMVSFIYSSDMFRREILISWQANIQLMMKSLAWIDLVTRQLILLMVSQPWKAILMISRTNYHRLALSRVNCRRQGLCSIIATSPSKGPSCTAVTCTIQAFQRSSTNNSSTCAVFRVLHSTSRAEREQPSCFRTACRVVSLPWWQ